MSSFMSRFLSVVPRRLTHTLPDLAYDYNALEPFISAEIMRLHHSKHHATYVSNLNAAEEKLQNAIAKNDTNAIIALQPALRFNGGGHINHSIFWENLSPNSSGFPDLKSDLNTYITRDFGSFENFKKLMALNTISIQGSGWGWLGYNSERDCLEVKACSNQDPLLATTGIHPLLGIDVWEHAYYIQYKMRPDYVHAIFNVINWGDVESRLKLGSGWGWLGYNSDQDRLEIKACANQDPLFATTGLHPLLGIDVWEHAYYLQYKNVRPDYVHAIFNIINWGDVDRRLSLAKK